jgi:D-proline reductase (dithiol) PrdB
MQTVGLAQQIIEESGIPTASITLLEDVTRKIRPPRALSVPFPLGFPLGEADNAALQLDILRQVLVLLERTDVPVLERFAASDFR